MDVGISRWLTKLRLKYQKQIVTQGQDSVTVSKEDFETLVKQVEYKVRLENQYAVLHSKYHRVVKRGKQNVKVK